MTFGCILKLKLMGLIHCNALFIVLLIAVFTNEQEMSQASGMCAPYSGKVCKHYLADAGQVWLNSSDSGGLNENITAGLREELINQLSQPCRSAAEKMLCMYAFPQCHIVKGLPVGLPLCYEDCIAIRDLFCYNAWALIESNKEKEKLYASSGHFRLPNCTALPRFQADEPVCSHANLTVMKQEEITYDCVRGRGRYYQGQVNKTSTGIPCQHWDSTNPHTHDRPPNVFPEVQNAENYCRNAGGEEPSPWCYTMDPTVRWQLCDIPICGDLITRPLSEAKASTPAVPPAAPPQLAETQGEHPLSDSDPVEQLFPPPSSLQVDAVPVQ